MYRLSRTLLLQRVRNSPPHLQAHYLRTLISQLPDLMRFTPPCRVHGSAEAA